MTSKKSLFYKDKEGVTVNNNLEKASRIFNIIKDLHEPNTKEEICEKYTINEKTFRNYFNGKDTDIEICNVNFPVNLKRKKDIPMSQVEIHRMKKNINQVCILSFYH